MKILFVTPYLCYPEVPYAGGVLILKWMEGLSARGHEVFLITGLRPGDRGHLEEVKPFCHVLDAIEVPWTPREVFRAVGRWCLQGFQDGLTFRRKAALSVLRLSQEIPFDLIQVEHTELGEYMERPPGIPMVINAHDLLVKPAWREYRLARGVRRWVKYVAWKRLERKEISIYRKFDKIHTLSEFDRRMLLNYDQKLNVSVISPYVRIECFEKQDILRDPNLILFVGAMDRPVNIRAVKYFYEEVFPRVKAEIPEAQFYAVGNHPPEEIKRMGEKDKDFIVTGFVENIGRFYQKASVLVAPLFIGGGIILKILDAMAAGLPVVTTTIGNEGIEATPDKDIWVADGPMDFARKVILLLREKNVWERLSKNGQTFVQEKFNWARTIENLEKEYKKLIA